MISHLKSLDGGVNLLELCDVSHRSLRDVEVWLFAVGVPESQRKAACRQIMTDGFYSVSNIEYRLTVECRKT